MNLQFQIAGTEDIEAIFTQAKQLIDAYEDITSIDYEKVLAWVNRKITEHIREYRCVLLNGEKCAYYRLCSDGELDDLYVLPAYRNLGIGSKILGKCIAESKENLYLYVFSRNLRAISFYERHGFSVQKTVGNTRLIMARKG